MSSEILRAAADAVDVVNKFNVENYPNYKIRKMAVYVTTTDKKEPAKYVGQVETVGGAGAYFLPTKMDNTL